MRRDSADVEVINLQTAMDGRRWNGARSMPGRLDPHMARASSSGLETPLPQHRLQHLRFPEREREFITQYPDLTATVLQLL